MERKKIRRDEKKSLCSSDICWGFFLFVGLVFINWVKEVKSNIITAMVEKKKWKCWKEGFLNGCKLVRQDHHLGFYKGEFLWDCKYRNHSLHQQKNKSSNKTNTISGAWEFWSECCFKPLSQDGMESDVERKNSKMPMVWSLEQRADRILYIL